MAVRRGSRTLPLTSRGTSGGSGREAVLVSRGRASAAIVSRGGRFSYYLIGGSVGVNEHGEAWDFHIEGDLKKAGGGLVRDAVASQ